MKIIILYRDYLKNIIYNIIITWYILITPTPRYLLTRYNVCVLCRSRDYVIFFLFCRLFQYDREHYFIIVELADLVL